MSTLLADLDSDDFLPMSSPNTTPAKSDTRQTGKKRSYSSPKLSSLPTTPVKRQRSAHTPLSKRSTKQANENLQDLLDGAENWDWNDWGSPQKKQTPVKLQFLSPSKSSKEVHPPPNVHTPKYTRCVVDRISESEAMGHIQKVLGVHLEPSHEQRSVILRDDWAQAEIAPGDIIHVHGQFAPQTSANSTVPLIIINAHENLLITHPDLLITATSISTAGFCIRRPLLAQMIRTMNASDVTPALVWGNLLHEVMERCLKEQKWDQSWIDERINEITTQPQGLGELIKIDSTVDLARRDLKIRAKGIVSFAEKYISDKPKKDAVLSSTRAGRQEQSRLAVSRTLDVEEDIWSPAFGLRGKLDATVQAVVETDVPAPQLRTTTWSIPPPPTTVRTEAPVPFEIKTGKSSSVMEHRAQTMLYTLLLGERYRVDCDAGLLYYTQSEEVIKVPVARHELRPLIIIRNEIAKWIMRRARQSDRGNDEPAGQPPPVFLPPTIDDERICKRCYVLDACMLYRKAVDEVDDTTSPIADVYELKTSHLTSSQCAFFKKWESLISLEEHDASRYKKELWTLGAEERQSRGRCFARMVLSEGRRELDTSSHHRIHQFTYRFVRASGAALSQGSTTSLLSGHMLVGDPVTVSVEPDLLALARGFIIDLKPDEVTLGVDHELDVELIESRISQSGDRDSFSVLQGVEFRIDKDELFTGMARVRGNLAQLFYVDGDTRRLKLVVDLDTPQFSPLSNSNMPDYVKELNAKQQNAVSMAVAAQDYALILGMPGTGKTTVIAAIIQYLISLGKTVLLTSYTHSAVDNILLKLLHISSSILRLGHVDKIHPEARRFTLADRRTPTTIEQLEHLIMTPPVIATTCLSIDHPLFLRRKFDYCIVDEASQITLPTCLGPLRFADRFVLVGDHFQLPPLVRNVRARNGGLDVSLFRRLSEAHPHAVVELNEQYRMNEDIMLLSNKLIYDDRLRCGSEAVAQRTLRLTNPGHIAKIHENTQCISNSCWLTQLLDESCKAIFVDTDCVPALESRAGDLVQNEVESTLVTQVVDALIGSGVKQSEIGVISLYRQQIKLLSLSLNHREDIEILTADRSQGRDKECIIISMVRSNDDKQCGELVRDWRRLNVSFTRAKSKLIIFGSRSTLSTEPVLAAFFTLVHSRSWILKLPANAHRMHIETSDTISISSDESDGIEFVDIKPIPKKIKQESIVTGLARSRPILRDLLGSNDVNTT